MKLGSYFFDPIVDLRMHMNASQYYSSSIS